MPGITSVKIIMFFAAAGVAAALAGCGPTISLPVTVKTSKGETFRGLAQGPAFSGTVVVSSEKGTRCEGPYTTGQDRVISATAQCNDGRSATLRATLEADLVSAKGTAQFADGATAQVGIGKHAAAMESGKPVSSGEAYPAQLTSSEREIVLQALKSNLKDPYSAVISNVTARKSANGEVFKVCGMVNAKNSYGAYTGSRPFYVFGHKEGAKLVIPPALITIGDSPANVDFIAGQCA